MKELLCDLHTHSTFSDGTLTPAELIAAARDAGLAAVALTDHNTVAGLPSLLLAAEGSGVEAIPGVEISAVFSGGEMHIVGLGLSPCGFPTVTDFLAYYQRAKEESTKALVAALTAAGYRLDYGEIAAATEGLPNRAHVAAALTAHGYTASIQEAFDTLLGREHGFYREPERPTAERAIALLHSVGAVAVLAHPFYDFTEEELCRYLDGEAKRPHRFDAMETRYSEYTEEEARAAHEIALRYGLRESGGSDFHGDRKPGIALGRGRGALAIPYDFWKELRK